jgi:serine/threonine-protein kinase
MATPNELLERLEERFILGEIDQKHYEELKAKLQSRLSASPSMGSGAAGPQVKTGAWLTQAGKSAMPAAETLDVAINLGEMIGEQFRVEAVLGRGALGSVYKVFDMALERARAIKVVFPDPAHADVAFKQLVREFEARERIRDFAHILRTDAPQLCGCQGRKVIVLPMPLAERSLRDWLKQRPQRDDKDAYEAWIDETMGLFRQTCEGVKAIHDCGLMHLDLKPENILLVRDGKMLKAQVADFGLARTPGPGGMREAGTLAYMAPEQFDWRPKDIGPECDVYALGCILFEIIDGDPPFEGASPEEYRRMHNESEPPMYRWENVRPEWQDVVRRCLDKAPSDRFRTAGDLLSSDPMRSRATISLGDAKCPPTGQRYEDLYTFKCSVCGRSYVCARPFEEPTYCCETCTSERKKAAHCAACGKAAGEDAILLYCEAERRWLLSTLNGHLIFDFSWHPEFPLFWLPDGETIVCAGNWDKSCNQPLYLMAMSTGVTRQIGVCYEASNAVALSPDGTKIIFGQYRDQPPFPIFLYDIGSRETKQVCESDDACGSLLSHDNRRIIVYKKGIVGTSKGHGVIDAVVRDLADGASGDVLLSRTEVRFWLSPTDVVCRSMTSSAFTHIYLHEPGVVRVIGHCQTGTSPVLDPKGTWMAYECVRKGIFIMRPDGKDLHQVCNCDDGTSLSWSPDGERVAHVHGDGHEVVIDNVVTGAKSSFRAPDKASIVGWRPLQHEQALFLSAEESEGEEEETRESEEDRRRRDEEECRRLELEEEQRNRERQAQEREAANRARAEDHIRSRIRNHQASRSTGDAAPFLILPLYWEHLFEIEAECQKHFRIKIRADEIDRIARDEMRRRGLHFYSRTSRQEYSLDEVPWLEYDGDVPLPAPII